MMTADELKRELSYEAATGKFTWLINRSKARAGSLGGSVRADGYRVVRISGRSYLAHRLAWLHVYGEWPKGLIDHIDGDPHNNAIANLRDVSKRVNNQNQRGAQRHNKSTGLLGVSANVRNKTNPYVARIADGNGNRIHIGFFSTPQLAHAAYLDAKRALHSGCRI